jgi:hypothetical protein
MDSVARRAGDARDRLDGEHTTKGGKMKASDTLTFEVSREQQAVLDGLRSDITEVVAGDGLESSYRAWNAHFTACDAPLEPCRTPFESSYRAWNAAFTTCDQPIEHDDRPSDR